MRGPIAAITVGIVGVVGGGVGSDVGGGGFRRTPHTLVPRWPRTRQFFWILLGGLQVGLVVGLGVGFGAALAAGFASGTLTRFGLGFVTGFVVGFIFGTVVGLGLALFRTWVTPIAVSPSATPATTYRADRNAGVIAALMIGLAGGLVAGSAAGLVSGPAFGFEAAVVFGVCAGLPVWLLAAQVPLVKLAELVLACQRRGQVHFLPLLEDTLDKQVLRQAGAVYQFRHAALQERLAATNLQFPSV